MVARRGLADVQPINIFMITQSNLDNCTNQKLFSSWKTRSKITNQRKLYYVCLVTAIVRGGEWTWICRAPLSLHAILCATESTSSSSNSASTAAMLRSMVSSSTSARLDGTRASPESPLIPASLRASARNRTAFAGATSFKKSESN